MTEPSHAGGIILIKIHNKNFSVLHGVRGERIMRFICYCQVRGKRRLFRSYTPQGLDSGICVKFIENESLVNRQVRIKMFDSPPTYHSCKRYWIGYIYTYALGSSLIRAHILYCLTCGTLSLFFWKR